MENQTIVYEIGRSLEHSRKLTIRTLDKTDSSLVLIYDENKKKPICDHLHKKQDLFNWLVFKKIKEDLVCPICNSIGDNEPVFGGVSLIHIQNRNLINKPRPRVQLEQVFLIDNIEELSNGIKSVPTGAVIRPGDNDGLYIIQQSGRVYRFDVKQKKINPNPFFDITEKIKTLRTRKLTEFDDERGLLGFVFHPHYKEKDSIFKNILFGVYSIYLEEHTIEPYDHTLILSRFRRDITGKVDEDILLKIEQPQMNHNGGTILFGPPKEDSRSKIGYLYYGVGDGGGFNDEHGKLVNKKDKDSYLGNAQNLETHLGKILRIDVNDIFGYVGLRSQKYRIPNENPSEIRKKLKAIVEKEKPMFPEIYAYGLRNPWKFSFDKNGRLFIADVGQFKVEEVNLIKTDTIIKYGPNPLNFGWRALEGGVELKNINIFNKSVLDYIGGYPNTIPPILEYPIDRTKFPESAIIGGYIYDGPGNPTLKGKYIFGDFSNRIFFGFETESSEWKMNELIDNGGDIGELGKESDRIRIHSFAVDSMGEIYVLKVNTTPKPNRAALYKFISLDLTKEEINRIFDETLTAASLQTSALRKKEDELPNCKMNISIYTLSGYLETLSMPDAWIGSIDISRSKAFTAAAFSSDQNALTSRTIGELTQTGPWNASKKAPFDKNRPPLYGIDNSNPQYGIIPFPGGIPIYKNGKLVGGLGVSGDSVDNDEAVAVNGLRMAEKPPGQFQPLENIRIDKVMKDFRYTKIKKT